MSEYHEHDNYSGHDDNVDDGLSLGRVLIGLVCVAVIVFIGFMLVGCSTTEIDQFEAEKAKLFPELSINVEDEEK